ncbi:selenocysteine-specific translation elongation factor [Nocardioides caldifontis]|uniref:selenocysteine-specific translation elongation factor n=1 Tax=Nocardioides caldifontis TaxID=2588938 RepID=UPI0011DF249B|nr:selenocysteine-specific translation elongation factor [Nocardioides caldifontis]
MHVVATAGHVDHGKSTLVRALTGTDPDRLAEEHARGLSIELGYAWTTLPGAGVLAFVDVPGHERFVATMLSGVGPVPAALLVVAADDPWMPQAAEHLAALDALGVRHGVVAVTRSDLADPAPMAARAAAEIARTGLAGSPVVAVSARTGDGLDELRAELVAMVRALPEPEPDADVRLWVDRAFTVRGAGTVVTGTLPAGTVATGDRLTNGREVVRVRGVQSLGRDAPEVSGVARVALNLGGDVRGRLARHDVLVTPDAWHFTGAVDVRLTPAATSEESPGPPRRPLLHVGSVAVPAYLRPLGGATDGLARLTLERALPLRIGDRALLRDPGSRLLWGVTVLDPAPPKLERRGAARARADDLGAATGVPDAAAEVARRGLVHVDLLRALGVPTHDLRPTDGWLLGDRRAAGLRARLGEVVAEHEASNGDDGPGLTLVSLAERLGLPSPQLVASLVTPPLRVVDGRVTSRSTAPADTLPAPLREAVGRLLEELEARPFLAPTADRLREVGLQPRGVVAAAKAGRLLHLGDGIVLAPGADRRAVEELRALPQPFTTSEARSRLDTTRRVVLPLLQHLDRLGYTHRHPDDRRSVTGKGGS